MLSIPFTAKALQQYGMHLRLTILRLTFPFLAMVLY